jgi:outer membrane protein
MKLRQSSKWLQHGLIAISSLMALPYALAQDTGTRVAAVNVEKVFNESNMAKASQTKLQNEFTKRQNEIRDSAQKIKSAAEKLDRDSAVMSDAERARRQRELADQDRELQRKQREYTEDLNQRNFEERAKIAEKANQALKQIAEQRKIDVIIQDPASWYLRNTYLENRLSQPGQLTVCGEKIDLGKLNLPAYVFGSREDHIVPVGGAYATTGLLSGPMRFVMGASGHIAGVINPASKNKRSYWVRADGKLPQDFQKWLQKAEEHPGSWWPDWAQWLQQHSGKLIA